MGNVGRAWHAGGVMAARKNSAPKLGDVLLVTGPEAFLADRAVRSAIAAVSKGGVQIEVTELGGADLDIGVFAELTGPSLFAAERVMVLRTLENLPAEMVPHLLEYAAAPTEDVLVVLVHSGGQKGKAVLDKLRKASVNEVVATAPKTWELPQFVLGEIRLLGGSIDERAANALVDAVGHDLRALAGACSQLVSDSGGQPVEPGADRPVLRWSCRGDELRGRRCGDRRSDRASAGAVALGAGLWSRGGAGDERDGWWVTRPGEVHECAEWAARGRPGARGGRTAVEVEDPEAAGSRLDARAGSPPRSKRSRRPTPTSKAPPVTRATPWSEWSSPSAAPTAAADPGLPAPATARHPRLGTLALRG